MCILIVKKLAFFLKKLSFNSQFFLIKYIILLFEEKMALSEVLSNFRVDGKKLV